MRPGPLGPQARGGGFRGEYGAGGGGRGGGVPRGDARGAGAGEAERVVLALPAPVLAVGAAGLDDPDAGGRDVAGQAGPVAAGALDAGQADGPEPAQPAQQPGVAGRGDGELCDAE